VLPASPLLLATRSDGGNLLVNPPRPVWERSELTAAELAHWSFLVAATGRAMLEALPQLDGGCINYWDAGNWALNDAAEPAGPKRAREHRRMHLHLLGRSPRAKHPAWAWGESPRFPPFADRLTWAAGFERLNPEECRDVVTRAHALLLSRYGLDGRQISPWAPCPGCRYPTPIEPGGPRPACPECPAPPPA